MSLLQLSGGPLSIITSSLNIVEHTNLALVNKQLKASIDATHLKKIAKENFLCKCCGYIDLDAHVTINTLDVKTVLCGFCSITHANKFLYWDLYALERIKDFDTCCASMLQTRDKIIEHTHKFTNMGVAQDVFRILIGMGALYALQQT